MRSSYGKKSTVTSPDSVGECNRNSNDRILSWIWKRVVRKIVVCNPLDALGKLAISLDELLYGLPRGCVGDEQTDRQWRVMRTANPLP